MDLEAKKTLLRKVPYGLYVIGVKKGNELSGFTGTWSTQSSFEPPLFAIGVRKDSQAFDYIQTEKVFVVNFLSKDQQEIAKTFFRPPKAEGKTLGGFGFQTGKTGAPILDDAIGYLECKVTEIAGGGDHALVIGEVIEAVLKTDAEILVVKDTPWNYAG